jgi:hypothetical protein
MRDMDPSEAYCFEDVILLYLQAGRKAETFLPVLDV